MRKHMITIMCSFVFLIIGLVVGFKVGVFFGFKKVAQRVDKVTETANKLVDAAKTLRQ